MTAVATPDAARLVFAAVAGLILLLILIIKFKVHAMISILIGAVGIGLMAGMPLSDIIGSVNEGIGNTLKGIALLVGLGSMFGAILEESGGAQTLAVTMVRKFGDEKAAWALGITGLVVAMPVFFDAGLIILIPLAFSLAKRTKRSVLYYVIPLLAGLAVGHAFIPPTPGPVLVASMLGVDLGWVILIGIFCGIFAMIAAGPIWGSICGKKYMIEVPEHIAQQEDIDEDFLLDINQLQENTMLVRENIVDKQRLISNMLRSDKYPKDLHRRFSVLLQDINSLINHTNFGFERLEYLQDTVVGLINLDQNKIMKIFTLVSVLLMPPTLVASFYGMNVPMPLMDKSWMWVLLLGVMLLTVALVLFLFKRNKLL